MGLTMYVSLAIYLLWKTAQCPSVFPTEYLLILKDDSWSSFLTCVYQVSYQDSYFLGKTWHGGELNMPVRWETQEATQCNIPNGSNLISLQGLQEKQAVCLQGGWDVGSHPGHAFFPSRSWPEREQETCDRKPLLGPRMLPTPFRKRVLMGGLRA